jgi:adenylyl-sulfate kinase
MVVWLTGLPASGKSSIAGSLSSELFSRGWKVCVLDGDNLRHGLCSGLGFSAEHRAENVRRVAEVAGLMADAGMVAIAALVSPLAEHRGTARSVATNLGVPFVEAYAKCSVAACEARDRKGLYEKARRGVVPEFTGISAPYEAPLNPEVLLDTENASEDACVAKLLLKVEGVGAMGWRVRRRLVRPQPLQPQMIKEGESKP